MSCMYVPVSETICPNQYRRKLRCRNEVNARNKLLPGAGIIAGASGTGSFTGICCSSEREASLFIIGVHSHTSEETMVFLLRINRRGSFSLPRLIKWIRVVYNSRGKKTSSKRTLSDA